jgi:hypothetical protein
MLGIADTFDLVMYSQEQMEMGNATFFPIFQRGLAHMLSKYEGTDELRVLSQVVEGLSEMMGGVPKKEQH